MTQQLSHYFQLLLIVDHKKDMYTHPYSSIHRELQNYNSFYIIIRDYIFMLLQHDVTAQLCRFVANIIQTSEDCIETFPYGY